MLDQPEHRLAGRDLAAVPRAFEESGRLVGRLARALFGERDLEYRPPLEALSDFVQIHDLRIPLGPAPEPGVHDVHRVVAVEGQPIAGDVFDFRIAGLREEADPVALATYRMEGGVA